MSFLKIFTEKNRKNLIIANSILLFCILAVLVLIPFLPAIVQKTLARLLYMGIYFGSVYALVTRIRIMFTLAIGLSLMQIASQFAGSETIELIAQALNTVFFIYVVVRLIKQFALAKEISPMVILGSINGYLLTGLVFSIFVLIVATVYPQSYQLTTTGGYLSAHDNYRVFIYYTFITMTTVGYGDIVPVSAAARSLAILMAVTGQLYIAVIIAFLVGKFAGHLLKKQN
ncbi:MAG: ion channel [bacterium]